MIKNKKYTSMIAIICISFLQMSMMGLSVILQDISKAFPDVSQTWIQFLATLPDLFIMISVLLCGKLLAYMHKKKILLVSCILFGICGIGGYMFHSTFRMLLLWSSILGIAIGSMMPTVIALINEQYIGEQREVMLGYQNSAIGFGGLFITLFASILAFYHWYGIYLLYLWGLFCLIFIMKLPNKKAAFTQKQKQNIQPQDWKWICLYSSIVFIFFSLYNAISTNVSMYLHAIGKQETFYSSLVIAMLLLGSLLSGLCYGKLTNIIRHTRMLFGFALLILGLVCMISTYQFPIILIGAFVAGSSLSIVMATATSYLSIKTSSQMAIAIMLACSDLGGFLSFLFIEIANMFTLNMQNNGVFYVLIFFSSLVFLILLLLFLKLRKKGLEI